MWRTYIPSPTENNRTTFRHSLLTLWFFNTILDAYSVINCWGISSTINLTSMVNNYIKIRLTELPPNLHRISFDLSGTKMPSYFWRILLSKVGTILCKIGAAEAATNWGTIIVPDLATDSGQITATDLFSHSWWIREQISGTEWPANCSWV
jgi:hypothetical protein